MEKTLLKNSAKYMKRLVSDLFEIRILEKSQYRTTWSCIRKDFEENWDSTRRKISSLNRTSNVFFTLNPLLPGCQSKTAFGTKFIKAREGEGVSDSDIAEYRYLYIDFDPERTPKDISASDEEKNLAWEKALQVRDFMIEKGFYPPIFCDSGNGYHLLFRISLENTKENTNLVRGVLLGLSDRFSDDFVKIDRKVFNAARISKYYGTYARKGRDDQENGRPHRPSGFIDFPDLAEINVNEKSLLESLAVIEEKKESSFSGSGSQEDSVDFVRNFFEEHDIDYKETDKLGATYFYLTDGCVFNDEHKGKDACVIVNEEGKRIYKCFHDSCEGKHWKDFVRVFEPDYKTFEERQEADKAFLEEVFGEEVEDEGASASRKEMPDLVEIERNEKGKALATIDNYLRIFRNDPMLKDMFGFNELSQMPFNMNFKREWRDSDDSRVLHYIETRYKFLKFETFYAAVKIRFDETRFHPIRKMIDDVVWDGVPRVETAFIDYLGAEDSKYSRFLAKMLFVAAVARVYDPGCKYDNMVIFVGDQGCGKSTFCERMALDPEYFTDSVRGIGTKEGIEQLSGSWIVEWGEMSAMRRAKDAETLKLFISQRKDKCRKAWGRRVEEVPRMCVFIGTSNDEDGLLTDRTGNRRFFPIDVGVGKKSLWSKNINDEFKQIYAEAKVLYKKGFDLTVPKSLLSEVATEQESKLVEDPREGIIDNWISCQPELKYVCTKLVWDEALDLGDRPMTRQDSIDLGRIFKRNSRLKKSDRVTFEKYGRQKTWEVTHPDFDV